jgi:pimeloyl-ACP methyl ester carboxylesterase
MGIPLDPPSPLDLLRASIVGSPEDVFNTPALAREFCFTARTPDAIVRSCAARLESESAGITRDLMKRLPDAGLVKSPMLVLGAADDGMHIDGDALAVAQIYRTDLEIFPDMGHVMMLEPGWESSRRKNRQLAWGPRTLAESTPATLTRIFETLVSRQFRDAGIVIGQACHGMASAHAMCPSKPSDLAVAR